MNNATRNLIASLEGMRLPELQAKYAEIIGEESRCPNKRFLIRRISVALEAGQGQASQATGRSNNTSDTQNNESGDENKRISKMSVSELRSLYREVVGRDTSSSDVRYLVWKVRQAEKGRIPVGPRGRRRPDGEAVDFKVLPLRMEAEQVLRLDEARERLGLSSRMDLFRRALHAFFESQGEGEVAALFSSEA